MKITTGEHFEMKKLHTKNKRQEKNLHFLDPISIVISGVDHYDQKKLTFKFGTSDLTIQTFCVTLQH